MIGFFDTVYWSRRFRRHMERKRAGVMTAIPQFTVPEIFVEDEAAQEHVALHENPFEPMAGPSSALSSPRAGAELFGGDGAVTPPQAGYGRAGVRRGTTTSIQITPTSSPTRARAPTLSRSRTDGSDAGSDNWNLADAISRPVSPLGVESADVGGRNRAGSSVSAQDVLEALDESAWGESIRKSFSQRRPSGYSGRKRRE